KAKKRQKARGVRPKAASVSADWQESRVREEVQKPSAGNGAGAVSAGQDQSHLEDVQPSSRSEFSIVGVGASAGGLEAFTQFLKAMPSDTGMALILVQHLSPKHEIVLPELLSGTTTMPVIQVTEEMEIKPNHVYVMPPNVSMGISHEGKFHLSPRPQDRTQHTPIDTFLRSLAEYGQQRAIAVILSGTATDGSRGMKEVKAVGGITLAQEPGSAKYDGMPRAAIATGMVDKVLPPQQIANELSRISHHPLVRTITVKRPGDDLEVTDEHLGRIFLLLRNATKVDFTYYKQPTIRRRLQRRMVLHKISSIEQYLKFLGQNPEEVQALYGDILIHVTRFFREPESFETLRETVFPAIVAARQKNAPRDEPIRVWTPGCATGEEAYSIGIALLEFLGETGGVPIQIFATDISETAVEAARTGIYPESIGEDVSAERLRRFFTRVDGSYKVNKQVRDMCIFARQDLTRDPPFSRLDLIVCRNVLIYLSSTLQKRMMGMFHYALKPTGFLLLGAAETIGASADLFGVADKRHRLYMRKNAFIRTDLNFTPAEPMAARHGERGGEAAPAARPSNTLHADANRMILERFSPPAVILDSDLRIIQFRGHTGTFLEPAPGDASLSVLKMAREGLLYGLRAALNETRRTGKASRKQGLRVKANGEMHDVNLEVVPMDGPAAERHFLVLFDDVTPLTIGAGVPTKKRRDKGEKKDRRLQDNQIRRLQQELAASRDYLQSIIQDLEAANEELQSANEEILSSNEELQSTNEELDTAKEELQSTNEELNTVNEELHGRNEELSQANGDLINLLASVHVAIVMVARDLKIRRFTPMAEKVMNLIPSDVGRPISDIKPNIDAPDLEKLITEAIDGVVTVEREVRDRQGKTLSLRIRPYKNLENRIDGAVVAVFDQEPARRQQLEAVQASELFREMLDLVEVPAVVLDEDYRIVHHNPAFGSEFRHDGQRGSIYEVMDRQVDIDRLRLLLEEKLPRDGRVDRFDVGKSDGQRPIRASARQVRRGTQVASVVLAFSK
ncbi:MAG TPA: chemotaxis protein CheB, partial [Tepidisphaeraceae bacterium]|nr:chemotaxis protein CheB [Tepidisphaeraceae bacterium]